MENNRKKRKYVHVKLGHFAVKQKLTECCKLTITQFLRKKYEDYLKGIYIKLFSFAILSKMSTRFRQMKNNLFKEKRKKKAS